MAKSDLIYRIGADASKFVKELRSAESGADRFSYRTRRNMRRVAGAFTAVTAATAALGTAIAVKSTKNAAQFEQAITNAATKTGDLENALASFQEAAIQAGASSAYSATEAAQALEMLAMSGYSVEESVGAVNPALQLAAAGGLELAEAVDIATGVTQGFALGVGDLTRVNDVLALAANSASTDVRMLGDAMSYAAPVAAGLGVSLEETSAVMAVLADNNIKASRAGTSFNTILSRMAKASKQLGGTLQNADIRTLGFAGALEQLVEEGLDANNAIDLFGTRGGPALQALLSQGSKAIRDVEENLKDAGGTAERVATQQLDTLSGALQIMNGVIETASISLGMAFAPMAQKAAEEVTELASQVAGADEVMRDIQQTTAKLLLVMADFTSVISRAAGGTLVIAGVFTDMLRIFPLLGSAITNLVSRIVRLTDFLTLGLVPGLKESADSLWDTTLRWERAGLSIGKSTGDAARAATSFNSTAEGMATRLRSIADEGLRVASGLDMSGWEPAVTTVDDLTQSFQDLRAAAFGFTMMGVDPSQMGPTPIGMLTPDMIADRERKLRDAERKQAQARQEERLTLMRRQREQLKEEGKRLFDATRTPIEAYDLQVERLGRMLNAGAISQEVFNRALDQAEEAFTATTDGAKELADAQGFVERMLRSIQTPLEDYEEGLQKLRVALTNDMLDKDQFAQLKEELEQLHDPLGRLAEEARLQELEEQAEEVRLSIMGVDLEARRHLETLQMLYDENQLTWEEYRLAVDMASSSVQEATGDLITMAELGDGAIQHLSGSIINGLVDPFNASIEDMLASFTKAMARMALEATAQLALNAALGGAGGGAGSLVGLATQSFSSGGPVSGPGTSTSDSIPAYLSDGEYVLSASTARQAGRQALDAWNFGGKVPRFARGGQVGSGAASSTPAAGPKFVLVHDTESAMREYMRSPQGQEVIILTVQSATDDLNGRP